MPPVGNHPASSAMAARPLSNHSAASPTRLPRPRAREKLESPFSVEHSIAPICSQVLSSAGELCNKGYSRMNEFEAHEASYEHGHTKVVMGPTHLSPTLEQRSLPSSASKT